MIRLRSLSSALVACTFLTAGPLHAAPELLRYTEAANAKRAAVLPTRGARAVEFNAAARALASGEHARLTLPNGTARDVVYERSLEHENGDTTWVGYLAEAGKTYRVVVTSGAAASYGRILTPEGEYAVTSADGQTWLIDHAAAGGASMLSDTDDALPPPDVARRIVQERGLAKEAGPSVIDVLVLYSTGFASANGGDAGALTRINHFMALANQAYIDSQVAIDLRLVGTQKIDYPDSTPINTTLSALSGFSPSGVVARAPAFAQVPSLRDALGADLVSFVRTFNGDTTSSDAQKGTCGLAWIGGSSQSPISQYAESAYSVVDDGRYYTDATHYRFCSEYTFAHELSHNMGSMHDRAQVLKDSGQIAYGAYAYSFGYGSSGAFGTIMSYIRPLVGLFSNPDLTLCAQQACGVSASDPNASADNALSLNNTRTAVANFRTLVAQASNASGALIVEYYNTPLNHYFMSADPIEKQNVESGAEGLGWQRTGQVMKVGGSGAVCRFYGNSNINPATGQPYGPNSHFYTIDPAECNQVKLDPGWVLESPQVFNLTPISAPGTCPSGTAPVYRAYNNRALQNDSNHRYSTDLTIYNQMIAQGWKGEGVVFCAPL